MLFQRPISVWIALDVVLSAPFHLWIFQDAALNPFLSHEFSYIKRWTSLFPLKFSTCYNEPPFFPLNFTILTPFSPLPNPQFKKNIGPTPLLFHLNFARYYNGLLLFPLNFHRFYIEPAFSPISFSRCYIEASLFSTWISLDITNESFLVMPYFSLLFLSYVAL